MKRTEACSPSCVYWCERARRQQTAAGSAPVTLVHQSPLATRSPPRRCTLSLVAQRSRLFGTHLHHVFRLQHADPISLGIQERDIQSDSRYIPRLSEYLAASCRHFLRVLLDILDRDHHTWIL